MTSFNDYASPYNAASTLQPFGGNQFGAGYLSSHAGALDFASTLEKHNSTKIGAVWESKYGGGLGTTSMLEKYNSTAIGTDWASKHGAGFGTTSMLEKYNSTGIGADWASNFGGAVDRVSTLQKCSSAGIGSALSGSYNLASTLEKYDSTAIGSALSKVYAGALDTSFALQKCGNSGMCAALTTVYAGAVDAASAFRRHDMLDGALGLAASRTSALGFQAIDRDFDRATRNYLSFSATSPLLSMDESLVTGPTRGYLTSLDSFLELRPGLLVTRPIQRTREEVREQISDRNALRLEALLATLDPRLCNLWHGARMAAESKNPDRVRHALASLRELERLVVHKLAPDRDVLKWSSDPLHFSDGKPTRRARLLYICDPVACDPLTDYVHAEVASVLALVGLFNKGTHGLGVKVSRRQMELIFGRLETMLCMLIELGTSERD